MNSSHFEASEFRVLKLHHDVNLDLITQRVLKLYHDINYRPDRILCIVLVSVCGLVEWPMVVFEVTLLDFLPGRVLLLNTLFIFEVTLLHFDYRPGRPLLKSLYYILILKSLY